MREAPVVSNENDAEMLLISGHVPIESGIVILVIKQRELDVESGKYRC